MQCGARTKTWQAAGETEGDTGRVRLGPVRTVYATHVIKSAEVEELSRAEARNFDPSPTRWRDLIHRLATTTQSIASIAHIVPPPAGLESIIQIDSRLPDAPDGRR